MVWVNPETKVFHRQGDKWYGKTKNGKYMTEADAVKAGTTNRSRRLRRSRKAFRTAGLLFRYSNSAALQLLNIRWRRFRVRHSASFGQAHAPLDCFKVHFLNVRVVP